MNRLFQVSLRTIFEITFVVAVFLAFVYWRGQPREAPPGRYHLIVDIENANNLHHIQFLLDTQTGRTWRRFGRSEWQHYGTGPKP